ncbi:uncharacterized protein LOC130532669 isoform X1 [Takifugu flavidus]|uniref:uncharacterized protein LOC130532669 isoform X1 n=1 Tax=Takifugu flavidus TaxID=433684 RepID=UPI0025449F85|nr:uncharacterized protein LOC130532669 isoform X1 [Takifugu flavidus]
MECFPLYVLGLMVLVAKSQDTVIAVLDRDTVLHCADSEVNLESCHRVRWVKYSKHARQILLSKPKTLNFPDAERVEWRPDGKRNLSLWLTRVQPSDTGLYSCEIWRGWDRVNVRNTSLTFKECSGLPAVRAVKGASVNLTCPLDDKMATLPGPINVSWVMLKVAKPLPIASERAEVNGTSLSFRSVVGKDASWYRCNYTLGDGHRCYDINLQVQGQVLSHYEDSELSSTPVMESREQEDEEVMEVQQSIKPLAAALTAIAVAMAAAAAGLFIYCRCKSHAVAPGAQAFEAGLKASLPQSCGNSSVTVRSLPTGAPTSSYDEYENTDYAVYKHSSIYQEAPQVSLLKYCKNITFGFTSQEV